MQQETYVVGVDYGTLSGRALVVRVSDGEELGTAVHEYPHAVMDTTLAAHAAWTGLPEGIAVAVGNVDAHVTAPVAAGAYSSVAEYQLLHDYFGRGANDVMKRLKTLRKEALA